MRHLHSGQASYDGAPTVALSRSFTVAKSAKTSDKRIIPTVKIAMILMGMKVWVEQKSVTNIKYSSKKPLPDNIPPTKELTEAV